VRIGTNQFCHDALLPTALYVMTKFWPVGRIGRVGALMQSDCRIKSEY
jgi:hypothetical protein